MTQIIPFESASGVPALFADMFAINDDLSKGVGGGYPHVSIKGKVFHITRGDEKTLVTRPDEPDEPASSIDVVIVKANSAFSKVYYAGGYVEGSDAKPLCYSNDSLAPAADSEEKQSTSCATCPHNQWGSRISESGGNGKACADSRRIAIAPLGQLNDPMLIRVPAASLKTLAQYNDSLVKRGVPYQAVVTKIGFDYTVAHPALTFKAVGFIDDSSAREVKGIMDSQLVSNIIGTSAVVGASTPKLETTTTKPVEKAVEKALEKVAAKPKTTSLDAIIETAKPTNKVEVESSTAEAVTPAKAAKPKVIEVDSMDDLLGELDGLIED